MTKCTKSSQPRSTGEQLPVSVLYLALTPGGCGPDRGTSPVSGPDGESTSPPPPPHSAPASSHTEHTTRWWARLMFVTWWKRWCLTAQTTCFFRSVTSADGSSQSSYGMPRSTFTPLLTRFFRVVIVWLDPWRWQRKRWAPATCNLSLLR